MKRRSPNRGPDSDIVPPELPQEADFPSPFSMPLPGRLRAKYKDILGEEPSTVDAAMQKSIQQLFKSIRDDPSVNPAADKLLAASLSSLSKTINPSGLPDGMSSPPLRRRRGRAQHSEREKNDKNDLPSSPPQSPIADAEFHDLQRQLRRNIDQDGSVPRRPRGKQEADEAEIRALLQQAKQHRRDNSSPLPDTLKKGEMPKKSAKSKDTSRKGVTSAAHFEESLLEEEDSSDEESDEEDDDNKTQGPKGAKDKDGSSSSSTEGSAQKPDKKFEIFKPLEKFKLDANLGLSPYAKEQSTRQRQLGLVVLKALTETFQWDSIDVRLKKYNIEIAEVEMKPSLRAAVIYWHEQSPENNKIIDGLLKTNLRRIRYLMTQRMKMKFSPEIKFLSSKQRTREAELDHLFTQIKDDLSEKK